MADDNLKKYLDLKVLSYAITQLGNKINVTFLKKKDDEISEKRINEIFESVFEEDNDKN